ncbi:MAG: hypothetical protein IJM76_05750 [Lachnospiraceae bacterium]|nr:hypothetical protein [Lachnospiraceae bacterium]
MVHVQTQRFYEKYTGAPHEVTVTFGHVSIVSHGWYDVRVDGEFWSNHDSKAQAFEEVVDIIKTNGWSPICPV